MTSMPVARSRWIVVALATLTGCVTQRQSSLDLLNAQPAQEYRGHYTVGERGSWFRACDAAESEAPRWVTVTGDAVAKLDAARREGKLVDDRPSYVHWRAVLTRGGEVGPPGSTALLVREVLTIRPSAGATDCLQR